jgi:hypothetical protein
LGCKLPLRQYNALATVAAITREMNMIEQYHTKTKHTEVTGEDIMASVTDWPNLEGVNVIVSSYSSKQINVMGTLVLTHEQLSILKAALAAHEVRIK